MNSPMLQKIGLSLACAAGFALAAFSGHALISYFFDNDGDGLVSTPGNLDELLFKDAESEADEPATPAGPESIPERGNMLTESPKPSEEMAPPPYEPEPEPVVVVETEQAEEASESEVVVEARAPVTNEPLVSRELDESPREEILSNERFLVRVPNNFPGNQGNTNGPSGPDDGFVDTNPSDNPPVIPEDNPPVTPDPESPDPPGEPPADGDVAVTVGLGDDEAGAGLELSSDEDGAALNLSVGTSSSDNESSNESADSSAGVSVGLTTAPEEPSTATPPPAPGQSAGVVRTPSRDGRVRIGGGNSLYNNALGGSVSGLIGGMGAPTSSERVTYRPANAEVSLQSNTGVGGITPNPASVTSLIPSTNITVNGAVPVQNIVPQVTPITSAVPVNAGGGGGSGGGAGGVTLPVGVSTGGGNVNVNVPTNIVPSTGVGINTGGLNINVNLGGR